MLTLAKRNLLSWLTNRIKEQQLLTLVSSLSCFTNRNKEQQLLTLAKKLAELFFSRAEARSSNAHTCQKKLAELVIKQNF